MNPYLNFLAFIGALPVLARAESLAPAPTTLPSAEPGGGWLQVIFGLLLVAGLLAASLYLLKRLAAPRGAAALLRVISAVSLGPRERVVVVETGETWLVLGVTATHISKLHELPRQKLPETELPGTSTSRHFSEDFAARLKQLMENRHAR
ncbi:MAG: flagellar biosynthetic protein FliO [Sterolibacterium sp.]|jgi:flagellar protein FliO/FliZ|nr:flagellar biosynthetic protein FliO [Sterolibacterium sp.]